MAVRISFPNNQQMSSFVSQCTRPLSHTAQWFQTTKTRHKMSSLDVISRVFPSRYQQNHIYFCFREMSFILKICQTVAGLSIVRQFHFWNLNFGGFDIWPYCAAPILPRKPDSVIAIRETLHPFVFCCNPSQAIDGLPYFFSDTHFDMFLYSYKKIYGILPTFK